MTSNPRNKVWINGISGKMGLELQTLIKNSLSWQLIGGASRGQLFAHDDQELTTKSDELKTKLKNADLWLDFSTPDANAELLAVINASSIFDKSVLIGTTGLSDQQKAAWTKLASHRRLRLLIAPNTSLGILLTLKISQQLARVLDPLNFDIEILESHHRSKFDAPSGTAKFLGEGVAGSITKKTNYARCGPRSPNEIGIASLRGGTIYGEHELRFLGDHEEIVISHRALNRTLFGQGALILAEWIMKKNAGSWNLSDINIEELVDIISKN